MRNLLLVLALGFSLHAWTQQTAMTFDQFVRNNAYTLVDAGVKSQGLSDVSSWVSEEVIVAHQYRMTSADLADLLAGHVTIDPTKFTHYRVGNTTYVVNVLHEKKLRQMYANYQIKNGNRK
jgi:hypothetical protein